MWPNPQSPQFPADLVTITQEILNEKLHFLCSEKKNKHLTMDDIYRYCKNCFTPTEKDQVYQKKM